MAVWSGANVAGIELQSLNPDLKRGQDSEGWVEIHQKVVERYSTFMLLIDSVRFATKYTAMKKHYVTFNHIFIH